MLISDLPALLLVDAEERSPFSVISYLPVRGSSETRPRATKRPRASSILEAGKSATDASADRVCAPWPMASKTLRAIFRSLRSVELTKGCPDVVLSLDTPGFNTFIRDMWE